MNLELSPPSTLTATINLPASKSISNRILILQALAMQASTECQPILIDNIAICDDTYVMQQALRSDKPIIDIMAAGTAMRFLTAYFASIPGKLTLTGTARMKQRPIAILVDALRLIGAHITYTEQQGYPPLAIQGETLTGGSITLAGNISSQYISALLLIAPTLDQGLHLHLTGTIISHTYIEMTLSLMRSFGAHASWANGNEIVVKPGGYHRSEAYTIENDWSAASYWYELLALSPDATARVSLPQLSANSLQGDAIIAEHFEMLGIHTQWTDEGIVLTKKKIETKYFKADFTTCPDLAQTVIVTCAMLRIPFAISGLQTLKIKETDRISALQNELTKYGITIEESTPGTLTWDGTATLPQTKINIATYDDHRMAMAFAPTAMRYPGIMIEQAEVVSKSYPQYWEHLRQAGFLCKPNN